MHDNKDWEQQAADALKSVARRMDIKAYVEQSPLLYGLLPTNFIIEDKL
ncbi:hypothetical protein MKX42_16890 [Paenibacillus sp. FSL R7-0204]